MKNLSDLIDFENENSSLDFKAIQYKKEMYGSFLKDIMALANSTSRDDKYIITGIKHFPNGEREKLGITENFIDDATYQQLVDANIEPHIGFNYFPYEYEGKLYGIFEITDNSNPPYMMKKDYGNLKSGDSYIRKGSFQKRLSRKDIDQYNIPKEIDISNEIHVSFKEDIIIHTEKFYPVNLELPSEVAKKKIEEIIKKKEQEFLKNPKPSLTNFFQIPQSSLYGGTAYENRDLPTLRQNLQDVYATYQDKDYHYLNEKIAYKLNFFIHNNSSKFLEDASVELTIPKSDKYLIRDSIYPEPYSLFYDVPRAASFSEINYPYIENKETNFRIYEEIGNIRHKLPMEILKVPLRLVILEFDTEIQIEIAIKIFAKNITHPILEILTLSI